MFKEKMNLMMNQVAQYRGLEDEYTIIFFGLCERYEKNPSAELEATIWETFDLAMGYC